MKKESPVLKQEQYPRLISDKPCGKDLFVGEPQKKLAEIIAQQIKESTNNNSITERPLRMIGIEGVWGSGKSNLVEQVKNNLGINKDMLLSEDEQYLCCTYDVWGHQNDLQRKSILTELVGFLVLVGLIEKDSGDEKIKMLTGKSTETQTKTVPKFSLGIVFTFLAAILSPLFNLVSEETFKGADLKTKIAVQLIPLVPLVLVYAYYVLKAILGLLKKLIDLFNNRKNNKRINNSFLKIVRRFIKGLLHILYSVFLEPFISLATIYKDKELVNKSQEFTSETEASFYDFNDFMENTVSKAIGKKHLLIVFDNMDRLPVEKVHDLWASIHTFFAEKRYLNITTIITFDRSHIRSAFDGNDNSTMGDDYIDKTFDAVYRVSLPIMTDWKEYLKLEWQEAFGKDFPEDEYNRVEQAYDLLSGANDYTPRKIIRFVNQVVIQKQIFSDEIPERYIAIFVLARNTLLEDSPTKIADKTYLNSLKSYYSSDKNLDKFIAALVYQVKPEKALSAAYKQQLLVACRNKNFKFIDSIKESYYFSALLDDLIFESTDLESLIICLAHINDNLSETKRKQCWDDLYKKVADSENTRHVKNRLLEHQKKLLENLCDTDKEDFAKSIISFMEAKVQNLFEKGYSEDFKECAVDINYVNVVCELKEYFTEGAVRNWLDSFEFTPDRFINLMENTGKNISEVKISCDKTKLDECISSFDMQSFNKINYMEFLDAYFDSLSKTKAALTTLLSNQTGNAENFKKLVSLLKQMSKKNNQIDLSSLPADTSIVTLGNSVSDDFKFDLLCIAMVKNLHKNHPFVDWLNDKDENNVNKLAEVIEYYYCFGNVLLNLNLFGSYPLYKAVCKQLVESSGKGYSQKTSIDSILKNFDFICSTAEIESVSLLKKIDELRGRLEYNEGEIENTINLAVLTAAKELQNDLSKKCLSFATQYFDSLTDDDWSEKIEDFSKYGTKEGIAIGYKWTDNFYNAVLKYFDEIAEGKKNAPENYSEWNNLVNTFEDRRIKNILVSIRDSFAGGKYSLTNDKFVFFGAWLFKYADISGKTDFVTNAMQTSKILDDENCVKILIENSDEVKKLFDASGDKAELFVANIRETSKNDDRVKELAEKLGIEIKEPSSEETE